jgi:hypothetical protein
MNEGISLLLRNLVGFVFFCSVCVERLCNAFARLFAPETKKCLLLTE